VQHDGGDWRCLVAGVSRRCSNDVLNEIRWLGFTGQLRPSCRNQTDTLSRLAGHPPGRLFHLQTHGFHEPFAGEPAAAPRAIHYRITCATRFATGDDFVYQYFQVIDWLNIY
jgi:hypothetical protein